VAAYNSDGNTLMNANPVIWATGSHGAYLWLTSGQHDLGALLRLCPQTLIAKYLAVTSFDSGPLVVNQNEVSAGWRTRNGIAYSPKIQAVENLVYGECGGYDEWYVFDTPAELGQVLEGNICAIAPQPRQVAVFVNYGGFGFHTPIMKDLVDLFWPQLEQISPESYIADGDLLNFVSRDKNLFKFVLESLEGSVPKS
jgi:hypothetical protein